MRQASAITPGDGTSTRYFKGMSSGLRSSLKCGMMVPGSRLYDTMDTMDFPTWMYTEGMGESGRYASICPSRTLLRPGTTIFASVRGCTLRAS
jgi:hypothetical protein